jgi:hypothetical protein
MGKPCFTGNVIARLVHVEDEVERRLPLLANVRAGIALRIVEQAVSRTDHGIPRGLPGERDARADGLVIRVDIGGGADAVLSGDTASASPELNWYREIKRLKRPTLPTNNPALAAVQP